MFVTSRLGSLFSLDTLMRMQRSIAMACRAKDTKYKSCFSYKYSELHLRFPSYFFDDVVEVEFEGYMLPAPKGWHESLSILYGDYMTPPPIEERYRE